MRIHACKPTLHNLASDFNVFLPSHKYQDISGRKGHMYLQDLLHGAIHIIFAWGLVMEYFHREGAPRNGESRRISVEVRELTGEYLAKFRIHIEVLQTLSAFIVAEVTISFKSLLRDKTSRKMLALDKCATRAIHDSLFRSNPIKTSVLSERS